MLESPSFLRFIVPDVQLEVGTTPTPARLHAATSVLELVKEVINIMIVPVLIGQSRYPAPIRLRHRIGPRAGKPATPHLDSDSSLASATYDS